jgi:sugar O-acyltransferase (sialic acid O-acetyltransferase NeuD family)
MTAPLVIIGAGGHARETAFAYLLDAPRERFLGFLDDRAVGQTPEGWPVLGTIDHAARLASAKFIIAINDPRTRRTVHGRLRALGIDRWATVLHPDLRIHASVTIGTGCSLLGGCQLTTNIRIGDHCILNRGAQVSHDCVVGEFSSLNPGACIAGNVRVGAGCEVGTASAIRQGTTVGAGCTVGMGAIVIENVPAASVVVGNPATLLRSASPW